ncbi:hypothetical protein V494_08060 [Pseudogymnoascus sp. VKM F-4513 (FW-928)]|nr:hypothetical protein V494_08060 [Pseudogymnoascus sp. VKM F-4513 (FW-928)]
MSKAQQEQDNRHIKPLPFPLKVKLAPRPFLNPVDPSGTTPIKHPVIPYNVNSPSSPKAGDISLPPLPSPPERNTSLRSTTPPPNKGWGKVSGIGETFPYPTPDAGQ